MHDFVALATQQLERIKVACAQLGLTSVDLPPSIVGVGVAIGFGETDFTVLSVMAGGSEGQLLATSGILNHINQDRLAALDIVNRLNQRNSSYTIYLHDADAGWSLLVQRTTPIEVYLDCPSFLGSVIRGLPSAVQEIREELATETALGGVPWRWSAEDQSSLLLRSML